MLESFDTLIAFVLIMLVVSLLITIVVQMVAAVLNLRGLNLLNGLKMTFTTIAPDFEAQSKDLARSVLKGRLLSDSFLPNWPILRWWRHASAIRPDEVFDSIHRIAIGKKNASDALKQNARNLLIALGVDKDELNAAATRTSVAQEKAKELTDSANEALKAVSDQAARDKIQKALNDVADRLKASEAALAEQIIAGASSIDAAYQKFQYWTCICEERVQQWFTAHTRIITVIFAVIFAYALQLDTVEIFKLVSSNKAVRDKLVAQVGAVQAQAAKVLADSGSVLQDAVKSWSEKQTDPAIKNALAKIDIKPTDTREEVRDKLAAVIGDKARLNEFDSIVNATATQKLDAQARHFADVKGDLSGSGFELFPLKGGRWGRTWGEGWAGHRLGVLFSVGLLSLGAPFWYNTLKNLASLRSAVAQNISKEQEQAQKQGDSAKAKPPPTVK